jgi:hypothetical protein
MIKQIPADPFYPFTVEKSLIELLSGTLGLSIPLFA